MWHPFAKSDLPLTAAELQLQRQTQKRIIIIAASVVVLLLSGLLAARPVHNLIKGWQARRHAERAFVAIDKQEWATARDEAVAGYQLRPTEPQALRAIARLFSRANQPEGLKFWKELRDRTVLTRADLRDEAALALRSREFDLAGQAIDQLLAKDRGGPTPADWLLAGQLALQQQLPDRAVMYMRQVFGSSSASDHDQLQAVLTLDSAIRGKENYDPQEIVSRLSKLAHGQSQVSLDALTALAQRIQNGNPPRAGSEAHGTAGLANSGPGVSDGDRASPPNELTPEEVIHGLETHPLARVQHKLLALDVNIHQHPDAKGKLIGDAIDQYKNAEPGELVALANWLNAHGEYERELAAIPLNRAMQNRDLFFQHVDALGALGRWDEIRRLIESEQFPLDPVVEHMYLARCFAQQNQQGGAENNWKRALQAAAGDLSKLMTLGDYAEKNGAYDVASSAFEAAVAVSDKSRAAQQGRLRVAYAQRDTKKIHQILTDLLRLWPNDMAVQNDEAYVRLLLSPQANPAGNKEPITNTPELTAIEALAAKLVEREPSSLPHRTLLALARLRLKRPEDALLVYKEINVPKASLTTSSIAVYAAVLAATGHAEEARAEFAQLPRDKMLPEEQELMPK